VVVMSSGRALFVIPPSSRVENSVSYRTVIQIVLHSPSDRWNAGYVIIMFADSALLSQ